MSSSFQSRIQPSPLGPSQQPQIAKANVEQPVPVVNVQAAQLLHGVGKLSGETNAAADGVRLIEGLGRDGGFHGSGGVGNAQGVSAVRQWLRQMP